VALVSACAMGATLPGAATLAAEAAPAAAASTTYENPVSRDVADTFADPSVIRGKDGVWYSFGTSDPLREGERTMHRLPIARSDDLVDWSYVGDAFTDATLPTWAAADAGIWAPDIRYVDGQYRLYYVVTETTTTPERGDNAIGMATAPTPTGPWTDSGAPVIGPRRGDSGNPGDFRWTFDPTVVTDTDGSQWLFYGSYYGGVHVAPLSADGRTVNGPGTMVAIDNKFEGAYVIRRDGWWYLFASTANCCAGPTTGYSVQVGRSRDLRGPYRDQQGVPLLQSRAGGTPVLTQNGNRWIGAGHNAVVTDLAGQDWIVYHAIDRADPYLDEPFGINERPMLLDRLDWVDGWPATRAGLGPSEGPQRGPVADADGTPTVRGATRSEADLRSEGSAYGLVLDGDDQTQASVVVDPTLRTVTLTAPNARGTSRQVSASLPAGYDARAWHSVVLETGGDCRAEVSHARLGDPLAVLSLPCPGATRGPVRAEPYAAGTDVAVANLSSVPRAVAVRRLAVEPVPSRLDGAASDEFSGDALQPGWTWVRPDEDATVTGGNLRWPTQAADLTGDSDNAGVLLRDVGDGDWAAVTKLTIDLGTDTVRNFQQGGVVVYVNDDLFTRLSHVAIWNTRQTEFGKEMPYAGGLSYGGTIIGPPSTTTWLRITHQRDRSNGEHELRGWTSTDGTTWVKGGVWTLPADADIRVGLVSHGGEGATATFDWFRVYRR
jgi:arabinan endo-1,5-alpha-L-arabinosidase